MEDLALVLSCVAGPDAFDPTALPDPPPPPDLQVATIRPPRIGVVRNFFPERTLDYMNDAINASARRLGDAGATVEDFLLPDDFDLVWHAAKLAGGEIEALHAARKAANPPPPSRITGVELLPVTFYIQARRVRTWLIGRLQPIFERFDALLMATAPGEAPEGPETTGDATLLAPWTFLGFPAITVNGGLGPKGLPLGLQMVGGPKLDYTLLQTGYWCEQVLGLLPAPVIA
jgi:Asp-tRNA(Asn)/Glu-tRNA(Gln) amidotransferase A subunit family amidase